MKCDIPLNDKKTFDFLCTGKSLGVFQCETPLGRHWIKKVQPKSIQDLSDLVAILRPGVLEAEDEETGKSVANTYCERKVGNLEVKYPHPCLEPVLKQTQGCIIYQEQVLEIARLVAGFNLQEADILRRAMGKKLPEEMAKIEKQFVEGCAKVGLINEEEATKLFDNIRKSQRYLFNKCLSPNTIVETINGNYLTLYEASVGDYIKYPITTNKNGYTRIMAIYDNQEQELYEIELNSGKTIQCTITHQFLCEDGKKRTLLDILANDYKIMCESD
jgi:DNA polymerase III subunit alpha